MALLKNSIIVAGWTAASRGLGFARDLLIANKLGAGVASDAFFIAMMLPNLLRRLFGEGAFNVAFVPILARNKAKSTPEALAFASAAFSWLMVVVAVVCVLGMVFMPVLVSILASGWVGQPEKFNLAVHLGRITFPYLGLITVAAFLGAMCNTFGKFAAYAMVPAILNLSILLCLLVLPGVGANPVEAAAWAIPLGGLAQVLYMVWSAKKLGLYLKFSWLPKHADLKPLLIRMGPAALGVGVLQLSIIIDNIAASWLPEGAITYLQMANRFYQLPLSLIGIAVATVLLPHLAVLLGEGNKVAATRSFTSAFSACLTLAVGACMGLMVLAPEMMGTLLQHGQFSAAAAQATAWAMMGYVIGLPGYIATKVTAPAFFAAEDPGSPVRASMVALCINASINVVAVLYLPPEFGHVGIALGTALGGYANAGLQWYWLTKKGVLEIDVAAFKAQLLRMLAAAGILGGVLVGFKMLWAPPVENLPMQIVWLALAIALGGLVFATSIERMGLVSLRTLLSQLKNRRAARQAATVED